MARKKQLIFDIDTKIASEILGESSYRILYDNIRQYLAENHFAHVQGSSYESTIEYTDVQVIGILDSMIKKYPYISKCVRDIRQADISRVHTLNHLFDYEGSSQKDKVQEQEASQVVIRRRHRGR